MKKGLFHLMLFISVFTLLKTSSYYKLHCCNFGLNNFVLTAALSLQMPARFCGHPLVLEVKPQQTLCAV